VKRIEMPDEGERHGKERKAVLITGDNSSPDN
jgi:hypothetical protein